MPGLEGHSSEEQSKVNILGKVITGCKGVEVGLSTVYLQSKDRAAIREEDSCGGARGDMAEHLEGVTWRWVLKKWDFGLRPAGNGKPTTVVTPWTSFSAYLCNLTCVIMALVSVKTICRKGHVFLVFDCSTGTSSMPLTQLFFTQMKLQR